MSNKAIKLCIIKQDFFVLFYDVEQRASHEWTSQLLAIKQLPRGDRAAASIRVGSKQRKPVQLALCPLSAGIKSNSNSIQTWWHHL